jgi:uncharacterized membrane protein YtjA (UPF0391 family)
MPSEKKTIMLRTAILFAIIALVAAGLGFYGLSDVSADIAKFFAVLFVVALLVGAHLWRCRHLTCFTFRAGAAGGETSWRLPMFC